MNDCCTKVLQLFLLCKFIFVKSLIWKLSKQRLNVFCITLIIMFAQISVDD